MIIIQHISTSSAFVVPPTSTKSLLPTTATNAANTATTTTSSFSRSTNTPHNILYSSSNNESEEEAPSVPPPETFREAEILGLRLMQEGEHEQALQAFQKGMKLPGSRTDIIRTARISGPSPVGGSAGGTEGKVVKNLDEFELQAAHYNIACACARLGKINESCQNLEQAFKSGFDNYDTVRGDPDLADVHETMEFETLMEKWNPKKGFFGFFK